MAGLQFERALFRVYDGILYPFAQDANHSFSPRASGCSPNRVCLALQVVFLLVTFVLISITTILHNDYVGKSGCLGMLLNNAANQWTLENNATNAVLSPNTSSTFVFKRDDVFQISIDWDGSVLGGSATSLGGAVVVSSKGKDVRAWPNNNTIATFPSVPDFIFSATSALVNLDYEPYLISSYLPMTTSTSDSSITMSTSLSPFEKGGPPSVLYGHSFRVFNITLPRKGCYNNGNKGGGSNGWMDFLLGYSISYDTVMINQLMWTFPRTSGYVTAVRTGESWGWGEGGAEAMLSSQAYAAQTSDPIDGLEFFLIRIVAIVEIMIGFFFFSSLAAVLVRTILTSGASLLYPFAACARCFVPRGTQIIRDTERHLNSAYPWLGAHMHQLRLLGERATPFLASHTLSLIFIIVLQSAGQTVLSAFFFSWKSYPNELPLLIWSGFVFADYFALVFTRSKNGLLLFPRGAFVSYLAFGTYYYTSPYAFFNEAAEIFVLMLVNLILACVIYYEIPLLRAGKVSDDRPRELMVRLAALEADGDGAGNIATGNMPQMWSLWMPLNYETRPLYEQPIGPVPGGPTTALGGEVGAPNASVTIGGGGRGGGGGLRGEDASITVSESPLPSGVIPLLREEATAAAAAAVGPTSRR
jgi:hypothetical protein